MEYNQNSYFRRFRKICYTCEYYGDINSQRLALKGLVSASGFLRSKLGKNLVFKKIPELEFLLDDSLDEEERIFSSLDNN